MSDAIYIESPEQLGELRHAVYTVRSLENIELNPAFKDEFFAFLKGTECIATLMTGLKWIKGQTDNDVIGVRDILHSHVPHKPEAFVNRVFCSIWLGAIPVRDLLWDFIDLIQKETLAYFHMTYNSEYLTHMLNEHKAWDEDRWKWQTFSSHIETCDAILEEFLQQCNAERGTKEWQLRTTMQRFHDYQFHNFHETFNTAFCRSRGIQGHASNWHVYMYDQFDYWSFLQFWENQ